MTYMADKKSTVAKTPDLIIFIRSWHTGAADPHELNFPYVANPKPCTVYAAEAGNSGHCRRRSEFQKIP